MANIKSNTNTSDSFINKTNVQPCTNITFKKNLSKRAKKKFLTQKVVSGLLPLNSPLHKQYTRAWFCASVIQNNINSKKLTANYCGSRCCMVCSGIRTMKLMDKYADVFKSENIYFVTLTGVTVEAKDLNERVNTYFSILQRTRLPKKFKRLTGYKLTSLRSFECTYSRGKFHPHFHLLVDGKDSAELVKNLWIEYLKKENIKVDNEAQKIIKANENSLKEVFKYITKFTDDKGKLLSGNILDTILQSTHKKHTVKATGDWYGMKPEIKEDEVNDLEAEKYNDDLIDDYFEWWINDWYGVQTDKSLSGYIPTENDKKGLVFDDEYRVVLDKIEKAYQKGNKSQNTSIKDNHRNNHPKPEKVERTKPNHKQKSLL